MTSKNNGLSAGTGTNFEPVCLRRVPSEHCRASDPAHDTRDNFGTTWAETGAPTLQTQEPCLSIQRFRRYSRLHRHLSRLHWAHQIGHRRDRDVSISLDSCDGLKPRMQHIPRRRASLPHTVSNVPGRPMRRRSPTITSARYPASA